MMSLVLYNFVLLLSLSAARETCSYLEWTGRGQYRQQKWRQCEYGCCGEGVDTTCCQQHSEDDYRRHWVITASIAGGVLLLCVVLIVILCVIKAKNVRRSRVDNGSLGSHGTRQHVLSPPPPYYPVNIFIVDGERDRHHRVAAPQGTNTHGQPHGQSHGRDQVSPVFNGEHQSSPPPYSFIDTSRSEWKTWQS